MYCKSNIAKKNKIINVNAYTLRNSGFLWSAQCASNDSTRQFLTLIQKRKKIDIQKQKKNNWGSSLKALKTRR